MRERGLISEPAWVAGELQLQLHDFARLDVSAKAVALPEMLRFVREHTTRDVLSLLAKQAETGFQERLTDACKKTVQTPFDVNGQEVLPWQGRYTAVAIDATGTVQGFVTTSKEDVSEFALAKAICASYLNEVGYIGGLGKVENFLHLQSIGVKPLKDIFAGSPYAPTDDAEVGRVHMGFGGCAVEPKYLKDVLALKDIVDEFGHVIVGAEKVISHDTQGGLFDNIFADFATMYLEDTSAPIQKTLEPVQVKELRFRN